MKLPHYLHIDAYGTFICLSFLLLFSSCVKDVDLDQSDSIVLTPDLQADLLYYTLNPDDFSDSDTGNFTPVIRDTVRLEFLDDSYIQENLSSVEFRFFHSNRFPVPFQSKIKFLDVNDRERFSVNYTIPAGTTAAPAVVDTLRLLYGSEIGKVQRSIQMVLELTAEGNQDDLKGELQFQSKGLFKFEF